MKVEADQGQACGLAVAGLEENDGYDMETMWLLGFDGQCAG